MNLTSRYRPLLFILQHQHQLQLRLLNTSSGNVSNALFTFNFTNKRREYIKKELLGYSMEQMYSVVSDVSNYYKFVPYVKKSFVHSVKSNGYKADLIVGFSPITESYTSNVVYDAPRQVTAVCHDGNVFKFLKNDWRFSPGLKDIPQSCVVDFEVLFQFKSVFHSQIANLFFDIICDQMEYAFQKEAKRRYGAPSINSFILSSRKL